MDELDALIAEVEASEMSARNALVASGEDEVHLAALAAELAEARAPGEGDLAEFGSVYRRHRRSLVLSPPAPP